MSADATDMVNIPRADLAALQAEVRRLRQEQGDQAAIARIKADAERGSDGPERIFTRSELAEAWGIVD